jgi:hypothetical protein
MPGVVDAGADVDDGDGDGVGGDDAGDGAAGVPVASVSDIQSVPPLSAIIDHRRRTFSWPCRQTTWKGQEARKPQPQKLLKAHLPRINLAVARRTFRRRRRKEIVGSFARALR